ncbi:hypothetical protein GQ600_17242 [Phytophthora cactorum]|nr:hypothetical protein GQ600_17242 [Phytophthora cactorum]
MSEFNLSRTVSRKSGVSVARWMSYPPQHVCNQNVEGA